jgi:hypothetical protein
MGDPEKVIPIFQVEGVEEHRRQLREAEAKVAEAEAQAQKLRKQIYEQEYVRKEQLCRECLYDVGSIDELSACHEFLEQLSKEIRHYEQRRLWDEQWRLKNEQWRLQNDEDQPELTSLKRRSW